MEHLPAPIDWTPPDAPVGTPLPNGHGFLIFSVDWDGQIQFLQTSIKIETISWDVEGGANVKEWTLVHDVVSSHSSRMLESYTDDLWERKQIDYGGVYRLDGYVLPEGVGGRLTTLLAPNPARLAPPLPIEEFIDGVLEKTELPTGEFTYQWVRDQMPSVEPRGGRPQLQPIPR